MGDEPLDAEPLQPNPRAMRLGLGIVALGSLLFFAAWWNRYLSPTSGGELLATRSWSSELVLYRGTYYQGPPGMPMLSQLIFALFGPHLIALLTVGVLLRIAGACALYALLLRIARPSHAAVATLTALFVSSVDISDTPYYYNHVGTAFVLVGCWLGAVSATRGGLAGRLAGVGSGALLTYAVAAKQTMLFASFSALLALGILALPRPRVGWLAWMASLVAGAAVSVGVVVAWLAHYGIVGAFLSTMRKAPQGKGGVGRSLFRPLALVFELPQVELVTIAALVIVALVVTLTALNARGKRLGSPIAWVLAPLALVLFVRAGLGGRLGDTRTLMLLATAVGWWGSLALALVHATSLRARDFDPVRRAQLALGGLSFGVGYSFAVSWPLFENMALPGLAVVLAALLERPPSPARERWRGALLALAGAFALLAGYRKAMDPWGWGLWREPPLETPRGRSDVPGLEGVSLSDPAAKLFNAVAMTAESLTRPGDRMYVYPNMPILYAIADRRPATFSPVHWVDTCTDELGAADAELLVREPPKLLVIREDPPDFVAGEERLYRGGRRSSVRDIVSALAAIKPRYEEVGRFRSPGATLPIGVYVRRDDKQ